MELFVFMGLLGAALIFAGYKGLQLYARVFSDDPEAILTTDMFLAMLGGPGIVPAVLCIISLLVGIWFLGNAISVVLAIGYHTV